MHIQLEIHLLIQEEIEIQRKLEVQIELEKKMLIPKILIVIPNRNGKLITYSYEIKSKPTTNYKPLHDKAYQGFKSTNGSMQQTDDKRLSLSK